MSGHISGKNGPPLPLPSLRLMVPPLRLVSAAIWQTVQQRHVMDYGMLEEFVTMVTEMVPELLNHSQRAQLILGLRARLVLELCSSKPITDLQTIQPHLDRIQTLTPLWGGQATDAEVGLSESNFLGLVQTLLKDPDEREHFFQDVFPVEFGPSYDEAIQKLVWQFLSRLEKLLPVSSFQQASSLLSDVPSVLEECVESVSHPQELKTVLQYHRDLGLLDNHERVVISTEQTESETPVSSLNVFMDTFTKELEVDSATLTEYTEMEPGTGMDVVEREESVECERKDNEEHDDAEFADPETEEVEPVYETVTVLGEDGTMEPLVKKNKLKRHKREIIDASGMPHGKKHREPSPAQMKSIDLSDRIITSMLHKPSVEIQRINTTNLTLPLRPVRRNRGCKMKTLLAGERKQTKTEFSEEKRSVCKRVKTPQNPNTCTVCGRVLSRFSDMKKHMQTHNNGRTYQCRNCQKTFKHLYNLQTHRKSCLFGTGQKEEVPSGEGSSAQFTTCETEFTQSSIDRRTCKVCGKIVHRIGYLSTHMKIHSENRHYSLGEAETVQKPSPEGGDKEPSSGLPLEATPEDSDSSFTSSTHQDPSYDPEPSQTKRPKCSSTAKKPDRKTFQKHICRICGKSVTAGAFEYHMRTHSGERPFSCPHPQCGMKFIHSGGLRAHLRRYCKVQTVDAAELDSFDIRFECDKCEKTFTIQSKLRKHKLIHGPLYCAGCRKVLPDLQTLTRHKLWHRPVQCSMCEESFMLTNLRTHYLDVHKFSGPFVCTHCPKSYKKFHSLIKHEMVHTGNLPLQCSQCPKRFIYNYDLVEHEKRHSDDRPCLCWECGKAFYTNIDLKQHMQNSHGEKSTEYRFPCRHCGKPFRLSNSRANHEKTQHGGVRYPCTYCGKQFVCADSLKRHDLIHTGERPFKCNHKNCDKAFRSRAELKIHMRYHTGERPFKCKVCGKGFVQANFLTTHYRTHTGEKPYSCSLCDKRFNYHDSLKRHMSTHSNEKPYKCLDCGKAFERKTLLNVHQRSCTS
ncbi:zinc finger protein 14-like isoform X2 [Salvelinus fontinalis]|uniref:zinc finger protein 14-like isoform X2 n=1 Tax=Salvelinus fontinalis TaxID=8038 RepID=UPI0024854DF4|nr:zinc finger protein 14-like isoform X2 [Salvelinus fontinalis]